MQLRNELRAPLHLPASPRRAQDDALATHPDRFQQGRKIVQGNKLVAALVASGLLLSGCSTRPRNFSASLAAPVADRTALEQDFRTCQSLVRQGRTSDFKAGAATALATGVGTVGTGVAMAGTGMVGITSSGGAAAAATAAMPVVGLLLGFGVSRMIRSGRERKYKHAMATCLAEYDYTVAAWNKAMRRDDAARITAETSLEVPAARPVGSTPD